MSEETKTSRRRRRRPRSSSRRKAAPQPGAQKKTQPQAEKSAKSASRGRRGRSRRRSASGARNKRDASQNQLKIQQHLEKSVEPINKDILIYTYTLRPRSLLDNYEAGANIAERMEFEKPEHQKLAG